MSNTITVEAKTEKLDEILEYINGELTKTGWSRKDISMIDITVEELFVNIASYAYPEGYAGDKYASIEVSVDADKVEMCFIDSGTPYNPLAREDPDITLSLEERPIGGLGIYIVKESMDEVSYRYEDGKNKFTILKKNNNE